VAFGRGKLGSLLLNCSLPGVPLLFDCCSAAAVVWRRVAFGRGKSGVPLLFDCCSAAAVVWWRVAFERGELGVFFNPAAQLLYGCLISWCGGLWPSGEVSVSMIFLSTSDVFLCV